MKETEKRGQPQEEKKFVFLDEFVTRSHTIGDVILLERRGSQYYIKAAESDLAGYDLVRECKERGLPIEVRSGLADYLFEGLIAGLIKVKDPVPEILLPEIGIALVSAQGLEGIMPGFINFCLSGQIGRALEFNKTGVKNPLRMIPRTEITLTKPPPT